MSVDPNVEQRLAALERAVADLQEKVTDQEPAKPWWHHIVGSFADEPAFDEVLQFARDARLSEAALAQDWDRPEEDAAWSYLQPKVSSSTATMRLTHLPAVEATHRLLFRALLEMRARGHEQKDKVVFHLADLFHNLVLEMQNAAEGRCTYDDVLRALEERAKEKGLDKWLEQNLGQPNPS